MLCPQCRQPPLACCNCGCACHACRDHILQEDLAQFGLSEKHAAEAFAMLDEDGDGHATLQVRTKLLACLMLCKLVRAAVSTCVMRQKVPVLDGGMQGCSLCRG